MSMVFCRGCAKRIHSTAVACPGCGAPQQVTVAPAGAPAAAPAITGIGFIDVIKKCTDFSGRARRKEYWMFVLVNFLVAVGIGVVEGALGMNGAIGNLYSLAMILPAIAVGVRRMHDTNHRGWWLLLPVVNLVFLVLDSQPGPNRFGPNPKGN